MSANLLDRTTLHAEAEHPPTLVRLSYLLMLASSLAFATMSACTHGLAGRCDWRITAIARSALAFIFAVAIAHRHDVSILFRWPRTLWFRSTVGSISMLFTFYALSQLPIATAVTIFNTFPIWVTLLAWPVLGERPTVAVALALMSAIGGVALIEQPHAGDIRPATLAAVFAAFCTAVVMLGLHRLRNLNSLAIVVHFSGFATCTCIGYTAVTAVRDPIDATPLSDPVTIALLLGVGGFATLGQIAMTTAFRYGPPQRLSIVGLSQVIFALGFDLGIWRRVPDAWTLAGITLVVAPVAWLIAHRPQS